MKNSYFIILYFLIITLGLSSCRTTNLFTIDIVQPAPVFLDSTLNKVGVINATTTVAKNKPIDVMDKVLTAEGKNLDKDAAASASRGVTDELKKNPRFDRVVAIDSTGLTTPGAGVFPASIPWQKLDSIAVKNDVEIIFVLSFFDTDTKIDYSTKQRQIKNPLGIEVSIPEHMARVDTRIKSGWRIYDVKNKVIKDEIILTENTTSQGSGVNPVKAVEAVINRKENVLEVSNVLGQVYGQRVLPQIVTVQRRIYVRGSTNLKKAQRYINVGDWDAAAQIWEQDVNDPKSKVAGRACYNLALISEIDGNLEKAIEWANKSYLEHNNKQALAYVNVLKDRLEKQRELEEQMKN